MTRVFGVLLALSVCWGGAVVRAQESEPARFHHVMINAVDPTKSIKFYSDTFGGTRIKFRGVADALFTEKSFILFNKVDQPADSKLNTGIWHIGWGGVDMKNEYEWWKRKGVDFQTPLTSLNLGPEQFYMYISGPDKELIEINTMGHHRFAHVHLFCTDVNETVDWYQKHLGLRGSPARPKPQGNMSSLAQIWSRTIRVDNVQMIFYGKPDINPPPAWWPEEPLVNIQPTKNHAIDRIGFSYRNIEPVYERMKAAGVKILEPLAERPAYKMKSFIVEAPNSVSVEIVESKPIPEGTWD